MDADPREIRNEWMDMHKKGDRMVDSFACGHAGDTVEHGSKSASPHMCLLESAVAQTGTVEGS